MPDQLPQAHRSLRLAGFVGGLAVLLVASAAPGAATAPTERSIRAKAHAIAAGTGGDYSQAGLEGAFGDMDPSMMRLAVRFAYTQPAVIGGSGRLAGAAESASDFSARALADLSWDAARLVNASIPLSQQDNPAARPLRLDASAQDRARAIECLAQAVYYEAAYEPAEGQAAVAQVVLNRLRHPVYPKTVCGVVYEGSERPTGCQFTFTCDGALARRPVEPLWSRSRAVAERALDGHVVQAVGNATHYHADYVVPYWIPNLAKVAKVGTHIFYRWSGGFGLPPAFTGRYAGGEPASRDEAALAAAQEAQAEADALVLARLGPVVETPTIELAAGPVVSFAPETQVARPDELKLEAPQVRVPRAAAPFAVRPACVNTTLGNCMNF